MAKYLVNDTSLTAVADAIRTKGGTTEQLSFPDGFVSAVEGIQAGGSGGDSGIDDILSGSLVEVYSEVTSLKQYALAFQPNLIKANLPNVERVSNYTFQSCPKLKDLNMPKFRFDATSTFMGCSSLERVVFPSLETAGNFILRDCASLKFVDFHVCTRLNSSIILNSKSVKVVVLRSTTLCVAGNAQFLSSSSFDQGGIGGVFLVPRSLVNEYPNATNWATFFSYGTIRFLAVEDYTVDGTITGELNMDKVNVLIEEGTA